MVDEMELDPWMEGVIRKANDWGPATCASTKSQNTRRHGLQKNENVPQASSCDQRIKSKAQHDMHYIHTLLGK
jgi:hypothetical protein